MAMAGLYEASVGELDENINNAINATRYDAFFVAALSPSVQTEEYARAITGLWSTAGHWEDGKLDRRIAHRMEYREALRRPDLSGNILHWQSVLLRGIGNTAMLSGLRELEATIAEPPNDVQHYILPFTLPNDKPYLMYGGDGSVYTFPDGSQSIHSQDLNRAQPDNPAVSAIPDLLNYNNQLVEAGLVTRVASLAIVRARIEELQS